MSTKSPIRVVLGDDHPVVLRGLENFLRDQPQLAIVACCSDGPQALDAIRQLDPDVALLDIAMPGLSGADVMRAARLEQLRTRFVLLTAAAEPHQVNRLLTDGAASVLFKDAPPEVLIDCLVRIGSGETFKAPSYGVGRKLVQRANWLSTLTPRERDIAVLLVEGLPNKEVAEKAGVTEGTVKLHVHSIYKKLGVQGRAGLMAKVLGKSIER